MKLWEKGYTTSNIVHEYTAGNDRVLDLKLAKYDVLGSIAHAKMLHKINLISTTELDDLIKALNQIMQQIEDGNFVIEAQFEDVHSKIEFELVKNIGDAGKKIHTARSRNDQVLVDLHLYVKEEIKILKTGIQELFDTLIQLAESHKEDILPGYTHMQVAMPSSFGLWFSSYAESLIDDLILLNAAFQISDQNPLGSAAGYGSSFPIDRTMTTELLGFSTLKYNVVAAQMSRGKLEKSLGFGLASLAGTLSKMSADICLFMSQNFGFLTFPNELTTGSSIMPHKKNPDVYELMRAKCNKIQQLPSEIMMITNNLTSGYHRDFQLLKENLMAGIEGMKENLAVANFMFQNIQIKKDFINDEIYQYMYSVETLNEMVLEGKSFRDAYKELAEQIDKGNYSPKKEVNHTHEGSIGNLCLAEIQKKFDLHF